jgi:hypothetical protein
LKLSPLVDRASTDFWLLAGYPPTQCVRWNQRHGPAFSTVGNMRRSVMPVLLLWAVPAVIVVGGVGYYLVRAVH